MKYVFYAISFPPKAALASMLGLIACAIGVSWEDTREQLVRWF